MPEPTLAKLRSGHSTLSIGVRSAWSHRSTGVRSARLPVLAIAGYFLAAAGCATWPVGLPAVSGEPAARCARWFAELDRVSAPVRDAQAQPIDGFHYLRTTRLLASFRDQLQTDQQWRVWLEHLRRTDLQSRRYELANLAPEALASIRTELITDGPSSRPDAKVSANIDAVIRQVERCGEHLTAVDFADPGRRTAIRKAAAVADDYSGLARAVGVYPLTRFAFAAGVARWQRETREAFARTVAAPPATQIRYRPAPQRESTNATTELSALPRDALGLIQLDEHVRDHLLAAHAPQIHILGQPPDFALKHEPGDGDRLAALELGADGRPRLAVNGPPQAYGRVEFTRIGSQTVPQLIYSFWFARRAAVSRFDPLAGTLDALVWRVTLDPDGRPLVYDAIHACGCYHMFFPTRRVQARVAPSSVGPRDEWLFMPIEPARLPDTGQLTLQLTAGTHDLIGVLAAVDSSVDALDFSIGAEDDLRSLPRPNASARAAARRSVYQSNGLIAGTERAERWWFWPMGIASAGAMRQWGHHATAFVGRRHFDDPDLIDQRFEVLPRLRTIGDE